MNPLPKDIEEAISRIQRLTESSQDASTKEATKIGIQIMALVRWIAEQKPTQRQRYKEAALTGLLAHPSRIVAPGQLEECCGQIADLQLAEDAEHAKNSNNEK